MDLLLALIEQHGITAVIAASVIGGFLYMIRTQGKIAANTATAMSNIATRQQVQSERHDEQRERHNEQQQALVTENIGLRERVASTEGALGILQKTASDDRERWAKREVEHQKEQLKTQAKMVQLETQLEHQQVTIDKLSKELEDGGREIRRLQSERDTMRFENTRLGASNKALTERLNSLQSRRERLEAEAGERDTQIIEMQRRLTACEETNEVSKKITDIPKDDNPPTQEQDIA